MTFEEWLRRPVYVVQCKTWALAAVLGVACVRFRCLPGYRDAEARAARNKVCQEVRRQRLMLRGAA